MRKWGAEIGFTGLDIPGQRKRDSRSNWHAICNTLPTGRMRCQTVQFSTATVQKRSIAVQLGECMLAQIHSAGLNGIDAQRVEVEVDISSGLPGWQFVGLPEVAVKESKERVVAAIRNSGIDILSRKITVNLSPAQWKKSGAFFDLPIALGLLAASEVIPLTTLDGYLYVGELSLKGDVLHIPGVLPIVMSVTSVVREGKLRGVVVPMSNYREASLVKGVPIVGVRTLRDVMQFLETKEFTPNSDVDSDHATPPLTNDMGDVRGQHQAKRAMVIAAAGGHNLIMISPPGSGKTMLAERMPSLLPKLSHDQSLDTSRIYSVSGKLNLENPFILHPPFRAPHHTASAIAVCGGGNGFPIPGEISLAHHGILFLDELPEFRRDVLETLREPMESGRIVINRARHRTQFPARFQLLAAMNPCPCGYYGHPKISCQCSMQQILMYRRKISGPLLDRIDLHIQLQPVTADELLGGDEKPNSAELQEQVTAARERQMARHGVGGALNAHIPSRKLQTDCFLSDPCEQFVRSLLQSGRWSARGFHRMLRVARTIADLDGLKDIHTEHIAEAIQYRQLDKPL